MDRQATPKTAPISEALLSPGARTRHSIPRSSAAHRRRLLHLGLRYLTGGLSLVPVTLEKAPVWRLLPRTTNDKPTWRPYQERAIDTATLRRFCDDPLVAGLAAVCGKVSGNLLILDFDAPVFYQRWRIIVGDLADGLPVQRTGGGGYHVALRTQQPRRSQRLAWVPNAAEPSGRKIVIETRGEGCLAILPGSLHRQGVYRQLVGDFATIPLINSEREEALLAAAHALDEMPQPQVQQEPAPLPIARAEHIRSSWGGVVVAYNAAHPIETVLEHYGYVPVSGRRWRRPGGHSSSVVCLENGRSWHHSTNDVLWCDKEARSPFDIFCILSHGGDRTAALEAAAQELGIK